jgi:hypothetical protein
MKRTFYQHGVAWERLQGNERSRRAEEAYLGCATSGVADATNRVASDEPSIMDLMLRAARGPLWPHPTKERRTQ